MRLHRASMISLVIGFLLLQGATASAGGTAAGTAPLVAAAIRGNIWLFAADGRWRTQLTRTGRDMHPVLSPDGRSVAFMRRLQPLPMGGGDAIPWNVMLARPVAPGRYRITRFSTTSPVATVGRAVVAWQPHSPVLSLAWFDRNEVLWKRGTSGARVVLHVGPPTGLGGDGRLVWSPDGRIIAAPVSSASPSGYPSTLRVALSTVPGAPRTITIGFRRGVLVYGEQIHGSYPSGANLTLDGSHLIFGTFGRGAGGNRLTGEFLAPLTGGTASMIFGNGTCVHNGPCPAPLTGATKFEYSPDEAMSATDPMAIGTKNRFAFWITGSVAAAFAVHIAMPRLSCVPAQWRWLPDSSGFAYVRACTTSRGVNLALVTVSLTGTQHVLTALSTSQQADIDLAPATRCIACG